MRRLSAWWAEKQTMVFVVVALVSSHQQGITALSRIALWRLFPWCSYSIICQAKDECQSLRYRELAADAQGPHKTMKAWAFTSCLIMRQRCFFANCTKISHRHDVFESVDEERISSLNVKTFEENIAGCVWELSGETVKFIWIGRKTFAKTGKK